MEGANSLPTLNKLTHSGKSSLLTQESSLSARSRSESGSTTASNGRQHLGSISSGSKSSVSEKNKANSGYFVSSFLPGQSHQTNMQILEPYTYLCSQGGKNIRGKLCDGFNHFYNVSETHLTKIKEIVSALHNSSLLVDDIEDNSAMRRGAPAAHKVYGTALTLNAANYIYMMAVERVIALGSVNNSAEQDDIPSSTKVLELCNTDDKNSRLTRCISITIEELLNLHRGQGYDIYWREQSVCPQEEDYINMVLDKTGGLFRLTVRLMHEFRQEKKPNDQLAEHVTNETTNQKNNQMNQQQTTRENNEMKQQTTDHRMSRDKQAMLLSLCNKLAIFFQVRDDYINLLSTEYMAGKDFCEDLTEGKFSFPIIHCINADSTDKRLLGILKQRTSDRKMKEYAVAWMREMGSFQYTYTFLKNLADSINSVLQSLGGQPVLEQLMHKLFSTMPKPTYDAESN